MIYNDDKINHWIKSRMLASNECLKFKKMSEQFCTRELLPNSIISLMGSEKYLAEYKSKRTSHSLRRESQLIPVLSSFFIPPTLSGESNATTFVSSSAYLTFLIFPTALWMNVWEKCSRWILRKFHHPKYHCWFICHAQLYINLTIKQSCNSNFE